MNALNRLDKEGNDKEIFVSLGKEITRLIS